MYRIPHQIVHAIENSGQNRRARTQYTFQAGTLLVGKNFARVAGTDRGDAVGELQASLHERDLMVELNAIDSKEVIWKAQGGENFSGKKPLVGEIVNGKNRCCPGTFTALGQGQIQWCQACMPIVTMQDVRLPEGIQPLAQTGCCPAEQGKALGVVCPGLSAGVQIRIAGSVKAGGGIEHITGKPIGQLCANDFGSSIRWQLRPITTR